MSGLELVADGQTIQGNKDKGVDKNGVEHTDVVFVSAECVELLKCIPMLMRDPKTWMSYLRRIRDKLAMEMDISDDVRYGWKSMLAPRKKTEKEIHDEKMYETPDPAKRMMMHYKFEQRKVVNRRTVMHQAGVAMGVRRPDDGTTLLLYR